MLPCFFFILTKIGSKDGKSINGDEINKPEHILGYLHRCNYHYSTSQIDVTNICQNIQTQDTDTKQAVSLQPRNHLSQSKIFMTKIFLTLMIFFKLIKALRFYV